MTTAVLGLTLAEATHTVDAGAFSVASGLGAEAPQAGLVMCAFGAIGVLVTGMLHLPVVAVVLSLFILVSGTAVTWRPTTTLALSGYPDIAGTASSAIGVSSWAFGGLTAHWSD